MSIIYSFECNTCGNKITTREQECKHGEILDESGWIAEYESHLCRECRPKEIQACDNECGTTIEYNTTGPLTKEDQLHDKEWLQDNGKWYCCDECHRESIF